MNANYIAKWNVSTNSWSALGNGVYGPVYALAVDQHNGYAGGQFGTAGVNFIAKWNLSAISWSALPMDGIVNSFAVDRIHKVEYGEYTDPHDYAELQGRINNVYARGGFAFARSVNMNNIARWNSSTSSFSEVK